MEHKELRKPFKDFESNSVHKMSKFLTLKQSEVRWHHNYSLQSIFGKF